MYTSCKKVPRALAGTTCTGVGVAENWGVTYSDDSLGRVCDSGLRIARNSVESRWLESCHIVDQCGCDGEAKSRRRFWRPK